MRVITVSELREMGEGAVPEAFRGKVRKVMSAVKSPEGSARKWKLQKLTVTDGKAEIQVVFSDRDDVPRAMEGREIYVVAANGERGLYGVKRKTDSYTPKGKTESIVTEQVWVYSGAEVTFDGASAPAQAPQQQEQRRDPPQQQRQSAPTAQQKAAPQGDESQQEAPPPEAPVDPRLARLGVIKAFNFRLAKNVSAYARCIDAAFQMVAEASERHKEVGGFKASVSDIKEIATTLFIQTCWNAKAGDVENFPVREFQFYLKEAKELGLDAPAAKPKGCPF